MKDSILRMEIARAICLQSEYCVLCQLGLNVNARLGMESKVIETETNEWMNRKNDRDRD